MSYPIGNNTLSPPQLIRLGPATEDFSQGFVTSASGTTQQLSAWTQQIGASAPSVLAFGAIGDGVSHPLSSVTSYLGIITAGWALGTWQTVFPFATALTNELNWCAFSAARLATPNNGTINVPAAAVSYYGYNQFAITQGPASVVWFLNGNVIPGGSTLITSIGTDIVFTNEPSGIFASALNGLVTATGSTTPRSLATRFADVANILDYGAIPSLSVDQTPNIQAAINAASSAGQGHVFLPAGQFRCASGITIPNGVEVEGAGVTPAWGATTGTILLFDAGVAVGVTMGAASTNDTCAIRKLAIGRTGGEPGTSTVGLKILDALQCVLEDVFLVNHGVGLYLRSDPPFGLGLMADRVWTAAIADAHLVVDGWPEARFEHFRFGCNGGHDYACNAYVRLTGGSTSNSAAGPNTVVFTNGQFNQSGGTVGALVQFSNQLSGSISDTANVHIGNCHAEAVNYTLENDSTWPTLSRVTFTGGSSLDCNTDFFNLVAGTALDFVHVENCIVGPMNLVSPGTLTGVEIVGNDIARNGGASSFTVSGTADLTVTDNSFGGNTSLGGTLTGGGVVFGKNKIRGGSFSNTLVSAYMDIDQPGWAGSWTPTLAFGGASTGITYSIQVGSYQITGGEVEAYFAVTITSKGTSTGAASVSLPLPGLSSGHIQGLGAMTEASGLANLTSGMFPCIASDGSGIVFFGGNSTGQGQTNDTNFTNTSLLRGTIRYRVL